MHRPPFVVPDASLEPGVVLLLLRPEAVTQLGTGSLALGRSPDEGEVLARGSEMPVLH